MNEPIYLWLTLALAPWGSALNVVVIWLSVKFYRKTDEPTHLFIASMTIADLCVTAIYLPVWVFINHFELKFTITECLVFYTVPWTVMPISAISLTLLNIDKFIYFHWPLQYSGWLSTFRAKLVVSCCWTVCGANVAILHVFRLNGANSNSSSDEHCNHMRVNPTWYAVHSTAFGLVPVLSSLLVSCYLVFLIRKFGGQQATVDTGTEETTERLRKRRVMFYVFWTSIWTAAALLPVRIFYLFRTRNYEVEEAVVEDLLLFLLSLDSMVKPAITLSVHRMYRNKVRAWSERLCKQRCGLVSRLGSSSWGRYSRSRMYSVSDALNNSQTFFSEL